MNAPLFKGAFPYQQDVLALPVKSIDDAANWYSKAFCMTEVLRTEDPNPTVVLDRDGVRIGFSVNGGDASQDGVAILVSDIHRAKSDLESAGLVIGDIKMDERDDGRYHVFFVVAPDELCYYFHQLITD